MAPKKRAQPTIPYSQPAETGTGNFIITQVFYAQEYLKDKDRPLTFTEIWDYLSVKDHSDHTMRTLRSLLQSGRVAVEYDPEGLGGQGSYRYKTTHNVRNAEQLLSYLQRQTTMLGIQVKELKDGWRDAIPSIDRLASSHSILVTRGKKLSEPRVVWADDPSLYEDIRPDFRAMWHQVHLPASSEELRNKLLAAGLKPATEKKVVVASIKKEKKRKGPRKGGRQTNTHMALKLKDYSHLRK